MMSKKSEIERSEKLPLPFCFRPAAPRLGDVLSTNLNSLEYYTGTHFLNEDCKNCLYVDDIGPNKTQSCQESSPACNPALGRRWIKGLSNLWQCSLHQQNIAFSDVRLWGTEIIPANFRETRSWNASASWHGNCHHCSRG